MNATPRDGRLRPLHFTVLLGLLVALLARFVWLHVGDPIPESRPGYPVVASKPEAVPKAISVAKLARERASDEVIPTDEARTTVEATDVVSAPEAEAKPDPRSEACLRTALALAARSPGEALRWAMAQPREYAGAAIVAAAYEVSREHPADALNALAELEPSAERDAALIHAASQWGAAEPKAAADWSAALPVGAIREAVCAAVAVAMADREPMKAADFVATQINEGVAIRTAAVSVAQRWAQHSPEAAMAWGEKFPEGSLREDILREIRVQSGGGQGKH